MRRTSIYKTFRVYVQSNYPPRHRGHFWKVNVFKTKEGMYNYSRSVGHTRWRGFDARNFRLFAPYHFKNGVVMFYRGGVSHASVAHEMAHVTIEESRRRRNIFKRFYGKRSDNERFCYLLDSLVQQFWDHYKRK